MKTDHIKDYEKLIREKDYQTGYQAEEKVAKFLNKLLGNNFVLKDTERYCYKDFMITNKLTNDKYAIEHKKRLGINKNSFETTIVPWSKIKTYIKNDCKKCKDLILIFSFHDGRFYTSWNKMQKLMKKDKRIQVKDFQRYKGFVHAPKKHLFIPVDYLKPLSELRV